MDQNDLDSFFLSATVALMMVDVIQLKGVLQRRAERRGLHPIGMATSLLVL